MCQYADMLMSCASQLAYQQIRSMSKAKLEKFAELNTFQNVLQNLDFANPALIDCNQQRQDLKGKWCRDFFRNSNPLVLELACGKGEYTVGMAQAYPDKNFIGVDLKGNRIWTGARKGLDLKLPNAAFVRTQIEYLPHFFAEGEVSEIWITFPDPYLKKSKTDKRLTSPVFLEKYRKVVKRDAFVHLKTDDPTLFEYSREIAATPPCKIVEIIEDVYKNGEPEPPLSIKTYYERMHLEDKRTIRYLRFTI